MAHGTIKRLDAPPRVVAKIPEATLQRAQPVVQVLVPCRERDGGARYLVELLLQPLQLRLHADAKVR